MRGLLCGAIVGLGLGMGACTTPSPILLYEPPVEPAPVHPVHVAIIVQDDWHGSGHAYPAEYVILVLSDGRTTVIENEDLNDAMWAMLDELALLGKVQRIRLALNERSRL